MRKTMPFQMFIGLLSLSLTGCSKDASIPIPANPPLNQDEVTSQEDINPEAFVINSGFYKTNYGKK